MKELIIYFAVFTFAFAAQPYYIQQCRRNDPNVNACLRSSTNRLAKFLRQGIPELGVTEVEPVIIDEIGISLGSGPDGYRAIFRNIEAFGVSNLTVTNVRSDIETLQFQMTFEIPKIAARAQYRSSGVLILVQASGSGEYWGEYDGVKAKVYFKAKPYQGAGGNTYLNVEQLKMDFSVKDIKMGVENIAGGNSIIQAALNLFINSNAQELLKEMKPALRSKLTILMQHFLNKLFQSVPYNQWLE